VLTEEIWVDETDTLSEEAIHNLKQSGIVIQEIRDSDHQLLRCWVQYKHVEHFLASTPEDRHYTIDRAVGRIEFGNGRWGKTPPHSGDDKIRVTYATGGGRRGNVAAHSIVSMQESIAYIDRVIHLEAASGGCDLGEVDEAVIRGPKRLIHLQRAVTAEDFEWLAREAHPNVAKVKCLPHRNAKLQYEPGAISVVVLPKSGIGNGAHFLELKRDIEQQLLKQAASHVAFPGRVQVIEPALLATGVNATLWVRHMDDIVPVEREVLSRLNIFLDPITGNTQGQGWEIGQTIHPSMFYALLKSVGSVFHIPQLALQLIALDDGAQQEITLDQMVQFPHGIVTPGEHRIVVEIGK
jgi:predicted phage baseplate assembly protein